MNRNEATESRSILLAVDGSPAAKSAAYAAARVASVLKWAIQAHYVVDASLAFNLYADPAPELGRSGTDISARQRIDRFRDWGTIALAEVEDLCRVMHVPVTGQIILGDVAATILNLSVEYPLIALGRRGNCNEGDSDSLGNNFRRIAPNCRMPLLIGGDIPSDFIRALLAYDGGKRSWKALNWAERLQEMFQEVLALSVQEADPVDHAWLEEKHRQIAGSSLRHYQFIGQKGRPSEVITSTADSLHADMILMGGPARPKLPEWSASGSLEAVLRQTRVPVLVTH